MSNSARVIALNTPNNILSAAWGSYRTTVDVIEAAAGLELLFALPLGVQNVVEVRTNMGPMN